MILENKTTLILIRHGITAWNQEQKYQGKTDIPLSNIGEEQAKKITLVIEHMKADVGYSSPLQRARKTAEIALSKSTIPTNIHDGLREIDFGLWEGLTGSEILHQYPKEFSKWKQDPFLTNTPQGESMESVSNRLGIFMSDILNAHRGKRILLFGHAGSFNILCCMVFGIRPSARWQFFLSHASISTLSLYGDIPVLEMLNNTAHLS